MTLKSSKLSPSQPGPLVHFPFQNNKKKYIHTYIFCLYSNANLILPVKSKKKRGSVMDFFSPFGDSKPFGGFGSHMSGTFGKETNTKKILNTMK